MMSSLFNWTDEDQKELDKLEVKVYRMKERKRMHEQERQDRSPSLYRSVGKSKLTARFKL